MEIDPEEIKKDLEQHVPEFIAQNIEKWMEETILSTVIAYCKAANLPQKFQDGIKIEQHEDGYELVNTWVGDNGEPLATWFEYGTRDHWVEPKNKEGVLAFPAPENQRHGSAIYYESGAEGMIFSKGHYVSGLPRTEAMTQGLAKGMEKFKRKLKYEIRKKFSRQTSDYKLRVSI